MDIDATIEVDGNPVANNADIELTVGEQVSFVIDWQVANDDQDGNTGLSQIDINGGDYFKIDLSGSVINFLGQDHYLNDESATLEDYMPLYMDPNGDNILLGHWAIISKTNASYIHFVAHDNIEDYYGRSGGFFIEGSVGEFDSEDDEETITIGSTTVTIKYNHTPPGHLEGIKLVFNKTDIDDSSKNLAAYTTLIIENDKYEFTGGYDSDTKAIVFDHIPAGTYTLSETVSYFDSYDLESLLVALVNDADDANVKITALEDGKYTIEIIVSEEDNGKTITLNATNKRKGVLLVIGKRDAVSGASIGWGKSGEFVLYDEANNVEVKQYRIDNQSLYYFKDLKLNTKYEIQEISAPNGGYDKDTLAFLDESMNNQNPGYALVHEDGKYYITFLDLGDYTIIATNAKIEGTQININKLDSVTKEIIAGYTTINLGDPNKTPPYAGTAGHNADGSYSFYRVQPGKYFIEEHTAAPGYDRGSLEIFDANGNELKYEGGYYWIEVTGEEEGPIELTAYNTKSEKGYISITKRDEQNPNIRLGGTKFEIQLIADADGNPIEDGWKDGRTTSAYLDIAFADLQPGTYLITETVAVAGYDINSLQVTDQNGKSHPTTNNSFELVVKAGDVYQLTATNSKLYVNPDDLSKTALPLGSEEIDLDGDGIESRYGLIKYTIDIGYDLVADAAKHDHDAVTTSTYKNILVYDNLSHGQYFDTTKFNILYEEYYPADATGDTVYPSGSSFNLADYFQVEYQVADETKDAFIARIEAYQVGIDQKPVIGFSSDKTSVIINLGTFGANNTPIAIDQNGNAITTDADLTSYLKAKGQNDAQIEDFLKSFGETSDAKSQSLGYTFELFVYAEPSEVAYSNEVLVKGTDKEDSAKVTGIKISELGGHITGQKDRITITKYAEQQYLDSDPLNNIPLAGVEFKLLIERTIDNLTSFVDYTVNGQIVTAVTDINGVATFESLPEGRYQIVETRTVAGYDINSLAVYDLNLGATEQVENAQFTLDYDLTADAELKFAATNDLEPGGGGGGGDGEIDRNPPEEEIIEEEPTPLGEEVVTITEETPLAPKPEEVLIIEEETPLGALPQTDDSSRLPLYLFSSFGLMAIAAILGLGKKRKA